MKKIRLTLLVIMGSLLILGLYLSSQDGATSANLTNLPMKLIGVLTESEIENETARYEFVYFFSRKFGHFIMYAIATLPIFLFIYTFGKRLIPTIILTLIVVMGYAVFDELRQSNFGRTVNRLDAMINAAGGSLSIAIATVSIWTQRVMNKVDSSI